MDKTLEQIRFYAEQGRYKRVPISKELYADAFTPISVMRTLRAASRHCYLLESAEDRQQWGRYSFLGYAPTMEITCTDGRVIISEGHEDEDKTRREVLTDHPGKVLREILEAYKSPVVPGLPPFTGGLVGYFSYDYIKYAEPTLKPVLEEAIALNAPVLIECQINCDDKVYPMVSPGAPIQDAFDDTDLKIK